MMDEEVWDHRCVRGVEHQRDEVLRDPRYECGEDAVLISTGTLSRLLQASESVNFAG